MKESAKIDKRTKIIDKLNEFIPKYNNKYQEYKSIVGGCSYYSNYFRKISYLFSEGQEESKDINDLKKFTLENYSTETLSDILKTLTIFFEEMSEKIYIKKKFNCWIKSKRYTNKNIKVKDDYKKTKKTLYRYNSEFKSFIKNLIKPVNTEDWNIKICNGYDHFNAIYFNINCKENKAITNIRFTIYIVKCSNNKYAIEIDSRDLINWATYNSSPKNNFYTQVNNALLKKYDTVTTICKSSDTIANAINKFYPSWYNKTSKLKRVCDDYEMFLNYPERWWYKNKYLKNKKSNNK